MSLLIHGHETSIPAGRNINQARENAQREADLSRHPVILTSEGYEDETFNPR